MLRAEWADFRLADFRLAAALWQACRPLLGRTALARPTETASLRERVRIQTFADDTSDDGCWIRESVSLSMVPPLPRAAPITLDVCC